ncbi:MAG: hypothetical protein ACWGQW_03625 [bacterium]
MDKQIKTSRILPCELTNEEFYERATELTEVEKNLLLKEAQRKNFMDNHKNVVGGLNARKSELIDIVENRAEPRRVDCEWFFDYSHGNKRLIRMDTEKVVETVALTDVECQEELNLDSDQH